MASESDEKGINALGNELHSCITQNDVSQFEKLFNKADDNQKDFVLHKWVDSNDEYPLIIHAARNNAISIVEILLKYSKININVECPKDGTNSVYHACRQNYTEMTRLLMKHGGV